MFQLTPRTLLSKASTFGGVALLCLSALVLPGTSPRAVAQTEPPAAEERMDLPLALLYLERPAASKKKDDPNALLQASLSEAMRGSERFRVLNYRPTHPLIRKALNEKQISPADLASEPLKPETLRTLARIVGARFVLAYGASVDAAAMRAEVRLEERVGAQDWRVALSDSVETPGRIGKLRLKTSEMADVTADAIAGRLGITSHRATTLSERIAKEQGLKPAPPANTPPPPTPPAQGTPPDKPTNTGANQEGSATTPRAPQGGRPQKTDPPKTPDKKPQTNTQVTPVPPTRNTRSDAGFSTDAARGPIEPTTPEVALAPAVPKPDNEALLVQYRRNGDLANVITSLRRAINEKPRDADLRRQLVLAYQERQMPDVALAELERALLLNPKDPVLLRLRGDTLILKGDTTRSIQALRDALAAMPNDVPTQVSLGDALMADNQYAEALQTYEAAAKSDPKSPLPHRRLARALLTRASKDPAQYTASLEQTRLAREMTPPTDVEAYREDHAMLLRVVEARLQDMLAEMLSTGVAVYQGKRTPKEAAATAIDMKARGEALADYLDKLPPAVSTDAIHARFQQSSALTLQAISRFRESLASPGDERFKEAYESARLDAVRELAAAARRLKEQQRATEKDK